MLSKGRNRDVILDVAQIISAHTCKLPLFVSDLFAAGMWATLLHGFAKLRKLNDKWSVLSVNAYQSQGREARQHSCIAVDAQHRVGHGRHQDFAVRSMQIFFLHALA